MVLRPLPARFAATRGALHRVAAHVMARRRSALAGRIGLRVSPAGLATPAAGPDQEVLRTSGRWLVRERTGQEATSTALDLGTASLAAAAAFVEVDLGDAPFSVGADTPELGAVDQPLQVDDEAAEALAEWFALGWWVIDEVVAPAASALRPSVLQLWPEHFDAGLDVEVAPGRRANLGASPGDEHHPAPYLYLGPWGDERPGDRAYWNAAFGALLGYDELLGADDPRRRASDFFRTGLAHLASARSSEDAPDPPGL